MNNLILCGFMGCGKSAVGRALAKKLQVTFIDMDHYIEHKSELSIPVIFDRLGEGGFRDIEHQVCRELSGFRDCVIATGGGAMNYSRNVQALKEQDNTIIFLNCPFMVCFERIRHSSRPLVTRNSKEQLLQIYRERMKNYQSCCDIEVDSSGDISQIVQRISAKLHP